MKGSRSPLREGARGLSLEKDCPRWSGLWQGGNSSPVHCPGQCAPPILLGQGRMESKTKKPKEETQRCCGEVELHWRKQQSEGFDSSPV